VSRSRKKNPERSCPRGRKKCGACQIVFKDKPKIKDAKQDKGRSKDIEEVCTLWQALDHIEPVY